MALNLQELNYILIPRPEVAERMLSHPLAKPLRPLIWMARHATREGQILSVVALICAAAGVDVRYSNLYLVFCGFCGLAAAALVLRPLARVPGLSLVMEHPPRVMAGGVIHFTAVLQNEGPRTLYALRVEGPFLPWDGRWVGARPVVPVLEPGQTVRVVARARLLVRGQRYLGRFSVGSVRPLGLLSGPRVRSDAVRLMVVPPVAEISVRGAAEIQGAEGRPRMGIVPASEDLRGVRPWRTGDRPRDLHARSWARAGVPMVREYAAVARRQVVLMVDPGDQPEKAPREELDALASLAAGLVAGWQREGAEITCLIGAEGHPIVLEGAGAELSPVLDQLATLETRPGDPQPRAHTARGLKVIVHRSADADASARAEAAGHGTLRWAIRPTGVLEGLKNRKAPPRPPRLEGPERWSLAVGDGQGAKS